MTTFQKVNQQKFIKTTERFISQNLFAIKNKREMIFNTIVNDNQKKVPTFNQTTNIIDKPNPPVQPRVTFSGTFRNKQQVINPTNKPQYHFTYGHSSNQFSQKQILPKAIYRNGSSHFQTFQIQPKHSLEQKSFVRDQRNRSESKRKKGLKIFPQKYDKNSQQVQKVVQQKKDEPKNDVNSEVNELKSEIEKLKQEIKNLSQNISKNTSREFTEHSVNKNEAQRTRRLSELNQFNQKLYTELALKLKQISIAEYDNYLDQTNSNKKILDEIFESSSKSRQNQSPDQKKISENEKFMDIKEFQNEYQQKYNSTGGTENPLLTYDFVPQHLPPQTDSVGSPFLMNQNRLQRTYQNEKINKSNSDIKRKLQKNQVFTFHKQRFANQRHFAKPLYQVQNQLFTLQAQKSNKKLEEKKEKQTKQSFRKFQFLDVNKIKNSENSNKTQKQIVDFNRQLQNKILRKRVNSQYTTINKQKKY